MAGQIIPRGERVWLVRVFLGRDPSTSKRRYHNHTIHGNKKDAEKYRNAVLRERDLGTFIEPSTTTLSEYLNQWLETSKARVTERTHRDYTDLLNRYIKPTIGNKRLSDIQPLEIQNLYSDLQKRGLSARTVRFTHTVLSSSFKQAVKWRMMVQNPASLVDLPKMVRKEMMSLTPEQAKQFLEKAQEDRFGILFHFALITGMRPEEYLGLQWKDVDLKKGVVAIQRTLLWKRGGGWNFGETKTPRSRRSIPLPISLAQRLTEHHRKQAEERLKMGAEYQNYDLVFASQNGAPIMLRNLVRRHFKPVLKEAGIPKTFRLYDLRHSCATLLLAAQENPKVVSERLGHANIILTLDTYSHVLPSMQQSASEKLENIISFKVGTL